MTKRSPILGYNHNVRHRGLVFHVQTEDSGVLSPHLFTHLFHGGVIVATRKLVYDVGAVEDVIKNLMQAQHKAVLKELKKGGFDEKIDQYLGGTPGLLPRGAKDTGDGERDSMVEMTPPPKAAPAPAEAKTAREEPPTSRGEEPPAKMPSSSAQMPSAAPPRTHTTYSTAPPPPKPPSQQIPIVRTKTMEKTSASGRAIMPPDPPSGDEPSTDEAGDIAAAVNAANAATIPGGHRAPDKARVPTPVAGQRSMTPVPMPARSSSASTPPKPRTSTSSPVPPRAKPHDPDSLPEIEIQLDETTRHRAPRDTEIEESNPHDAATLRGDSQPQSRAPASHGAATLPPVARPMQRPPSRPAVTPPTVMTRPVPTEDGRARRESEVIEVYAPPPPSVEPPPGEGRERGGQYIVNRTKNAPKETIPSGLNRPHKQPSGQVRTVRAESQQLPKQNAPSPDNLTARPRATTEARTPPAGSGIAGRPPSQGGVVMTRPAVIVGAPQKSAVPPTQQRVRKAREEEGRGFGQGLISEKSLDEVILAYLSEDAEDK